MYRHLSLNCISKSHYVTKNIYGHFVNGNCTTRTSPATLLSRLPPTLPSQTVAEEAAGDACRSFSETKRQETKPIE